MAFANINMVSTSVCSVRFRINMISGREYQIVQLDGCPILREGCLLLVVDQKLIVDC